MTASQIYCPSEAVKNSELLGNVVKFREFSEVPVPRSTSTDFFTNIVKIELFPNGLQLFKRLSSTKRPCVTKRFSALARGSYKIDCFVTLEVALCLFLLEW